MITHSLPCYDVWWISKYKKALSLLNSGRLIKHGSNDADTHQHHKVPSIVFVAKAALKSLPSRVPVRNIITTLEKEVVLARC